MKVGPVTMSLPPRARMAARYGVRWGVGALLVIFLVGLETLLVMWAWPVGVLFIAVLMGAGAAAFVYLEEDLFP